MMMDMDPWHLVKHGYERTPEAIEFDTAALPFGTMCQLLKESPDGSEWVKLKGMVKIPAGVYIRVRIDPHAENRKARRAARREHKAAGIAKKAIRKAQEATNG